MTFVKGVRLLLLSPALPAFAQDYPSNRSRLSSRSR